MNPSKLSIQALNYEKYLNKSPLPSPSRTILGIYRESLEERFLSVVDYNAFGGGGGTTTREVVAIASSLFCIYRMNGCMVRVLYVYHAKSGNILCCLKRTCPIRRLMFS